MTKEEELSRALNHFTGGDPEELFSARLYRLRWTRWFWLAWPISLYVDWRCHRMFGEPFPGHCKRVWRDGQCWSEPEPLADAMNYR